MATKKRVFISFDIDHDEGTKIMLAGHSRESMLPSSSSGTNIRRGTLKATSTASSAADTAHGRRPSTSPSARTTTQEKNSSSTSPEIRSRSTTPRQEQSSLPISSSPPLARATTLMRKPSSLRTFPPGSACTSIRSSSWAPFLPSWCPTTPSVGVTHPCRYEPDLNPTYQDAAAYYGTVVIPARVKKARDKAKVESAVLIAERWIIAALRNHTFFSIGDLNRAVKEKLEDFNARLLQKLKVSRRASLRDNRQTRHEAPAGETVRVCRVGET